METNNLTRKLPCTPVQPFDKYSIYEFSVCGKPASLQSHMKLKVGTATMYASLVHFLSQTQSHIQEIFTLNKSK